jgi:hypothetical protein
MGTLFLSILFCNCSNEFSLFLILFVIFAVDLLSFDIIFFFSNVVYFDFILFKELIL